MEQPDVAWGQMPARPEEGKNSARERLEKAFGKPMEEIYHETVAQDRKKIVDQIREIENAILFTRVILGLVQRKNAGENVDPDNVMKDILNVSQETCTSYIAEKLTPELAEKERDLREFDNLYGDELAERKLFERAVGPLTEFATVRERENARIREIEAQLDEEARQRPEKNKEALAVFVEIKKEVDSLEKKLLEHAMLKPWQISKDREYFSATYPSSQQRIGALLDRLRESNIGDSKIIEYVDSLTAWNNTILKLTAKAAETKPLQINERIRLAGKIMQVRDVLAADLEHIRKFASGEYRTLITLVPRKSPEVELGIE